MMFHASHWLKVGGGGGGGGWGVTPEFREKNSLEKPPDSLQYRLVSTTSESTY